MSIDGGDLSVMADCDERPTPKLLFKYCGSLHDKYCPCMDEVDSLSDAGKHCWGGEGVESSSVGMTNWGYWVKVDSAGIETKSTEVFSGAGSGVA